MPDPLTASHGGPLAGTAPVPGDKSISHRSLLLGSLTVGETKIEGLLESADVLATAEAVKRLGATVERTGPGAWKVWGVGLGGYREPSGVLDFGNSGTGVRLAMGALAGSAITVTLVGDASLSGRPMGRILEPLSGMGVTYMARSGNRLPLTLRGPDRLAAISYDLPVASAQVKSAVLLAGLAAPGRTSVYEAHATRDHTERMLAACGAHVTTVPDERGGHLISVDGEPDLAPCEIAVPADPSSAAFPVVAALVVPGSDIIVPGVMMNPHRAGLYKTLIEMGGDIEIMNQRTEGGEPLADLHVRSSELKGIEVPAERAPSMIDEYPVLAVAAAFAEGETRLLGLGELRVKESDRLAATAAALHVNGVKAKELEDALIVEGRSGAVEGGGTVATFHDHRIAMAFLTMGLASRKPVTVDDIGMIATSFPSFVPLMRELGARFVHEGEAA